MTIYGYIRVSTVEQGADGKTSLDEQTRLIRGVAMMRNDLSPVIFSDVGVSGSMALWDRPSGRLMGEKLKSGDILVASKMDRIFRSALDALRSIEELRARGVSLILADMGPDAVTESASAKLFFTMLAAFAEFERFRIAERMADGKRAKKDRGGAIGGLAPYGFDIVGSGAAAKLTPDPEEQAIIRRAMDLRDEGHSLSRVSDILASDGLKSRVGRPFQAEQIRRMVQA